MCPAAFMHPERRAELLLLSLHINLQSANWDRAQFSCAWLRGFMDYVIQFLFCFVLESQLSQKGLTYLAYVNSFKDC